MTIDIIEGPAAIRIGKYWIGVASGNRYANKNRLTARRAIFDATLIEKAWWCFKREANYKLMYKSMVQETVREMVKESALK